MNFLKKPALLFATIALASTVNPIYQSTKKAHAGIGGIGNATVNEGVLSVHARATYEDDDESQSLDERFRNRVMFDYGFTDDFALGLYIQNSDPGNDNHELEALILDARFELAEVKENGYYSGFRVRYTARDGDKSPDNAHVRLILGKPVNDWDFRVNQIIAYEIGEESAGGIGLDTRFQASYKYHPHHRAGIESFSNFGFGSRNAGFDAQDHTIGPIFAGEITPSLSYETGYRFGLSDQGADNTFKLFLTKTFQ